jgi:hypothetical protein
MNTTITLDELALIMPPILYEYLMACRQTPQSPHWHPEGPNEEVPHNVYFHTNIVYERARKYGDSNLMMASFFHDLGKVDTTKPNDHGSWGSHGHEAVSARLVQRYKVWIEEMGCNYELVYNVVKEHMRIKKIDEMRISKQKELLDNPYIFFIKKFTEFDDMSTL